MKVEDQLALILTKLDAQSKGISENNHCLHEVHESVAKLTAAKAEFERWRPKVDGQVADLRDCVDNLRQQLDELKSTSTPATPHHAHAGSASLKVPGSAHLVPSSSKVASRPLGHGDETHHRSDGSGVIYTLDPPPANDGLKPEIRAALLLHKPKDLDTASSLAILQEEILAGPVIRDFKKLNSYVSPKAAVRATTPSGTVLAQSLIAKPPNSEPITKPDDKLSALMTYRKARGLCFKCGGKWGPQHKCPATVPLNVIEEVVKGTCAAHTLKIHAYIHQKSAIILVDSSSSHNFISEHMAADLHPWTPLKHSMSVKCYDAILGMEWLETFSPMQIQWKEKWLSFNHQNSTIRLHEVQDAVANINEITLNQLLAMEKQYLVWGIVELYSVEQPAEPVAQALHPEIQELVTQFADLFDEPSGTPLNRTLTHYIPLVPGVQPFRLKPYRYTLSQKDEIEKQVAHLLKSNMIQESTSPFASPALLVKKKSGEWRLCVDYRRLNAYTVKNKFPMPIVEELFEELYGAAWFTTLDLSYKKGTTNSAADALSRAPHPAADLNAITVAQPLWIQNLQLSYDSNAVAQKMLSSLALQNPSGNFSLHQGIIKYKGVIWLGHSPEFQTKAKIERVPYPGLLQPLPVPSQAWIVVTMDFIEGLPISSGYNYILVVVDKFSKYSHFVKLKHPFSAITVAQQYMEHIYKLHVLYGHQPNHFGIDPDQDCVIPNLDQWLQQRKYVNSILQQQLLRAQQRMKHQADKNRSEREFQVGDRVWLKLQPYAQGSIASRVSPKLSFRYFGPYEVESKIGVVAYKLKLPPGSSVHNVFHVSLLKPVKDSTFGLGSPGHYKKQPYLLLIKWVESPAEMATWEDEDDLL
ncbi:uncharacterized protein [Miscanthus floridulus]|uniref:uncharacterized protein n=1 Tax=Miscanthus floridulus TaxID=154761 RepID=UPI00345893B8